MPDLFRDRGVGTKSHRALAVREDHADGRNDVVDPDCLEAKMRDAELLAHAEGDELHDGRLAVVEVLERRIDGAVENVASDQRADLLGRVYAYRLFEECEKVVNENRERGEVVDVRVRDDNVAHRLALGVVPADGDAGRVNRHAPVDDEATQSP